MSSTDNIGEKVIIPKESWRIDILEQGNPAVLQVKGDLSFRPFSVETKKDPSVDKRTEFIDNTDRVEVQQAFRLSKRSFGMWLIRTRLEGTT